jgi:type I restriction enzyme R subunit
MNKFPESETAARFRGDTPHDPGEYQVMIVAEKFQTGFDAPALHTMYVDKVLTGVAAVQTLSRLNRTMAGKEDTFVLDFRNDAEEIREAFRPFYDVTEAVPTDPNLLYDAERAVRAPDVIHDDDLETYWRAFAALPPGEKGNAALNAALAVPLARFDALDDENAEEFRDALDAFVRLYSFLSQVVTFTDPDLEKLYVFTKGLRSCLPPRPDGSVDLGSHVELTHLRIEKEAEVNATLADEDPETEPLIGYPGGGRGPMSDPETEHLSEIIARINERHGLTLSLTDALLFEQYEGDWTSDPELAAQARANSLENFGLVFDKKFFDTIFKRMDSNEAIFKMINDDAAFAYSLREIYLRRVYDALRA